MTTQPLSALTMLLSRHTKRRDFISLLGGAAMVWPLVARAQQPAMPVVGILSPLTPGSGEHLLDAFRRGLGESGYVEGQNLTIDHRLVAGRYDRFPEMAADLIQRRVSVIAAFGSAPAVAAKAATQTIPIVFAVTEDPVSLGLVASLSRPGGNATGLNFFTTEVNAKRLGLLRELVPTAARVALLMNPMNAFNTSATLKEVDPATRALTRLPLSKNPDGTIDIYFGPKPPAGREPNWLYTQPGQKWFPWFRVYGPEKAILDKSWRLPDIETVG